MFYSFLQIKQIQEQRNLLMFPKTKEYYQKISYIPYEKTYKNALHNLKRY